MKRTHNKNRKKLFIIIPAVVVSVAALSVGAVLAYSRSRSLVNEEMATTDAGVQIIESSDPGFGRKEISFYNNDENNSKILLRIAYSEMWTKNDGTVVSNVVSDGNGGYTNVVTKTWTSDFTNHFRDGGDGWYYYDHVFAPLQTVQVLSAIALNNPSYSIYNYDISFRFEAIQADANAASTLWGKTITVGQDGSVIWPF